MSKAPEFKQVWEEGDTCFIQCLGAELKNLTGDKYYEKKKEKAQPDHYLLSILGQFL